MRRKRSQTVLIYVGLTLIMLIFFENGFAEFLSSLRLINVLLKNTESNKSEES